MKRLNGLDSIGLPSVRGKIAATTSGWMDACIPNLPRLLARHLICRLLARHLIWVIWMESHVRGVFWPGGGNGSLGWPRELSLKACVRAVQLRKLQVRHLIRACIYSIGFGGSGVLTSKARWMWGRPRRSGRDVPDPAIPVSIAPLSSPAAQAHPIASTCYRGRPSQSFFRPWTRPPRSDIPRDPQEDP